VLVSIAVALMLVGIAVLVLVLDCCNHLRCPTQMLWLRSVHQSLSVGAAIVMVVVVG
jgi:hypothetical protein